MVNTNGKDVGAVLNRLCHMVVLTKGQKVETALDRLVLSLLVLDTAIDPADPSQVSDALLAYFNIGPSRSAIEESIDRAKRSGALLPLPGGTTFTLDPRHRAEVEQRVQAAVGLEEVVKNEWFEDLLQEFHWSSTDVRQELWDVLGTYMAKVFLRHGAETVALINPNVPIPSELVKSFSASLGEATAEHCKKLTPAEAERAVRRFFSSPTPNRIRYISELLDGAFTIFALSNDEATAAYLMRAIPSLDIFLDTNFIFGVLDLHVNPLVQVSRELVDVVKTHRFPFRLYFHEATLRELRNTIDAIGDRLKSQRWQQTVSRAAIRSDMITGLERKYHEKNAVFPLEPEAFLSQFEHVDLLLADMGAVLYREPTVNEAEETAEKGKQIAEYAH